MQVYVTYDLLAVLKGGFHLEERIAEDLKRHKQKQLAPPKQGIPRVSSRCIGFDTEFSPTRQLLTVGISDRKKASAFDRQNLGQRGWKDVVRKAKELAGHSITGDIDYLVKNKVAKESWLRGEGIKDSLLLARMVDENRGRGSYGLEALLLSEFNFTPWKSETDKLFKKDPDASKWSEKLRIERCRLDAWATLILAEHFYEKLLS